MLWFCSYQDSKAVLKKIDLGCNSVIGLTNMGCLSMTNMAQFVKLLQPNCMS